MIRVLTPTTGSNVRTVTAENILIAVGTSAIPPSGVDLDGEMILTSDTITSLARVPKTMAVIGGGVIGMEYASIFATIGVEVTVIEKRDRPLEFLDREIIEELMHQMRNRNVTFRLGEAVERLGVIAGPPKRAEILLESGKRIVSDMALFSIGRHGATDRLNLEAATPQD